MFQRPCQWICSDYEDVGAFLKSWLLCLSLIFADTVKMVFYVPEYVNHAILTGPKATVMHITLHKK